MVYWTSMDGSDIEHRSEIRRATGGAPLWIGAVVVAALLGLLVLGGGDGDARGEDAASPTAAPTPPTSETLTTTSPPGPPVVYAIDRGWFAEVLQAPAFADLGLPDRFVQVNQSRSTRGVIRGLHFQWDPPQGKLMRVVRGRAFMVAVDIRPGSPTLGRVVTLEASDEEPVLHGPITWG